MSEAQDAGQRPASQVGAVIAMVRDDRVCSTNSCGGRSSPGASGSRWRTRPGPTSPQVVGPMNVFRRSAVVTWARQAASAGGSAGAGAGQVDGRTAVAPEQRRAAADRAVLVGPGQWVALVRVGGGRAYGGPGRWSACCGACRSRVAVARRLGRHRSSGAAGQLRPECRPPWCSAAAWTLPAGIADRPQPQVEPAAPTGRAGGRQLSRPDALPVGCGRRRDSCTCRLPFGCVALLLLGTQWYVLFNVIAGAMAIPGRTEARRPTSTGWARWNGVADGCTCRP